jgi:hypothetical protein
MSEECFSPAQIPGDIVVMDTPAEQTTSKTEANILGTKFDFMVVIVSRAKD